mmetsp:Transcript_28697/g.56027  ORF Transcript_28697/g.56027 Transcript_28697/m.56027 type:complete len:283 (-) Transcript_28697:396-1244(-)
MHVFSSSSPGYPRRQSSTGVGMSFPSEVSSAKKHVLRPLFTNHTANWARKQTAATMVPPRPMSSASVVSLPCRGVSSRSSSSSIMILPHSEYGPTAVTRKMQSPSTTVHPERMKGSLSSDLDTESASPVRELSSIRQSFWCIRSPSAGTLLPRSSITTSPTMTSTDCMRTSMPLRRTVTAESCCLSCSTRNCASLLLSLEAVMIPMSRHAEMMAAPSSHSRHRTSPSCGGPRSIGPSQIGLRGHGWPRSPAHTMTPRVMEMAAAARRMTTVLSCIASAKKSQ